MMNKIYSVCLFLLFFNLSVFSDSPSVLIIGGGPAGLATAIEAKANGFDVTVVEKRDAYSRLQWLFLFDSSLKLLEKWGVNPPRMNVTDIGEGRRVGSVQIKHLEEQLEKRAKELGVKRMEGEFQGFRSNRSAIIVSSEKKELILPYDVIVGADGSHSSVRDALAIDKKCLGTAVGASAMIRDAAGTGIDITGAIKHEDGFLRRIKVPSASIVFVQFPLEISKNRFQKALEAQGWDIEARAIGEDKAFRITGIEISLHQAKTFSNEVKSAILVGDAAATASFFQGMGANTAFKTAEAAGRFFKEIQGPRRVAFENFNRDVKETTDAMIEDSAYLFRT